MTHRHQRFTTMLRPWHLFIPVCLKGRPWGWSGDRAITRETYA